MIFIFPELGTEEHNTFSPPLFICYEKYYHNRNKAALVRSYKTTIILTNEYKYSRMDRVKSVQDSL